MSINLDEEILCDYKVTTEMKKVWQTELDMLEKLVNVCKKHNIKYFISGGTLIGALRHGGFIPWDDDIDVGMLREDYNKLLEVADTEFKEPYFFQTSHSDELFSGHAQIRNSNTSAILPNDIYKNHNQGIFIDIFPYDEYPKTKIQKIVLGIRVKTLARILNNYIIPKYYHKSIKSKILYPFSKIYVSIFGYRNLFCHYEKVCSKYNGKGSGKVQNLAFVYNVKHWINDKEDFEKVLKSTFCGLEVNIPINYDKVLKNQYGNYMEIVKSESTHGKIIFDTECDYKTKIKELRHKFEEEGNINGNN